MNCLKKSWPSVEIFCYNQIFRQGDEVFFAQNPQLQCLELSKDGIYNLRAVADHFPNIDKLKLMGIYLRDEQCFHLRRLVNLTELALFQFYFVDFQHLNGLKNLKNLQVHYDVGNY